MNRVSAEGIYLIGKMNTLSGEAFGEEINVFSNSKEAPYLHLEKSIWKRNALVSHFKVPTQEAHEGKNGTMPA